MRLNQAREDREARKADQLIQNTDAAYATKQTVIGFASAHTPSSVDVKGPSPQV